MRKGFFLTESERNRISGLYNKNINKLFLIEAVDPPKDAEEVKAFQDWMDAKYPSGWATGSTGNVFTINKRTSHGYGAFPMRTQTKKAWEDDAKGGVYRKEKGIGGSMTETQKKEFRYWDTSINDWVREPLTKDEMTKAYNENKFKGSTRVYKLGMTYSNANYPMACQVEGLDIPCDPITPSTATGDAGIKANYQSAIGAQGLKTPKFASPYQGITASTPTEFLNQVNKNAGFNPYQSNNTHQFSKDGLKNYLGQIYGVKPDDSAVVELDQNEKKATITIGNTKTTYYYNQKNNTWDLPQTQGNVEFIQPKQIGNKP
jgi:hypothetical protein